MFLNINTFKKMSSSEFIKVDSALRYDPNSTNPSDCVIPSAFCLQPGKYSLKSIMLPISYHNINSTNNQLYYNDGVDRVAVVPAGYYSNFTLLATAVTIAMNAVSGVNYSATVSSSNNFITIDTIGTAFYFRDGVNSIVPLLGFRTNTAAAVSQVGYRTMNLKTTLSFNIAISEASNNIKTMNGKLYTFVIPAITSTPSLLYYECNNNVMQIDFTLANATEKLSFKIYDDQFNILNQMALDFYMIIQKM
jgi:hypothetical protein